MTNLQSDAESHQEQIRLAELLIQQLRTAGTPTNPPPPTRGTSQKQVTEGGAFMALTKHVGTPSEYHDWAFGARRVLTRADEKFAGLSQCISGTIDGIKTSDVLEYRRTTDLSTVDMEWLNSEMYTLLALKTTDAKQASIVSLEEAENQRNHWVATTEGRSARTSRSPCITSHRISDSHGKNAEGR